MRIHVLILQVLLLSNVLLRLFTNKVPLLPKALNIVDVPLTILLVFLAMVQPAAGEGGTMMRRCFLALAGFNAVLGLGALLNLEFLYPPAALGQVVMWNEPILLFLAVMRLPFTMREVLSLRKLVIGLVVVQFVIGLMQVPWYAATGETEYITGTFFGNAEQYQAFLVIGLAYFLAKRHDEPGRRRKWMLVLLVMAGLIVLIDNKASWLGLVASLVVVSLVLADDRAQWISRLRYVLALVPVLAVGGFLAVKFSPSFSKFTGLVEAWQTGNFFNIGKLKAFADIGSAYARHPHMSLLGSGPGNFYSRGGYQFYIVSDTLYQDTARYRSSIKGRTSNSMSGVINPSSAQEPFYKQFYLDRQIFSIGSGQVDTPFSSYAALLGETGLLGTLAYLGIYLMGFRRLRSTAQWLKGDGRMFPLALGALGLMVYLLTISIYSNWLETGRMTTILWALVAIVFKYRYRVMAQEAVAARREEEALDMAQPV